MFSRYARVLRAPHVRALVGSSVLARMPIGRVVGISARAVQTGLAVATMLAAVDRFVAERRRLARAA